MDIKEEPIKDDTYETKDEYNICCSRSSVGFVKFSTQFIISLSVLFFSMSMIILYPDKDNSIFFSLISGIVSLYIPPPSITHK
jgi:hypothetical protein